MEKPQRKTQQGTTGYNPEEDLIKVFVYGTLKVGGHFATSFDAVRKECVEGSIQGTLYNISGGFFPGVVLKGDHTIHGEIHTYSHGEDCLDKLDRIEGVNGDEGLYIRTTIDVLLEDGTTEEAIIYLYNQEITDDEVIEDGNWKI